MIGPDSTLALNLAKTSPAASTDWTADFGARLVPGTASREAQAICRPVGASVTCLDDQAPFGCRFADIVCVNPSAPG